MSVQSRGAAWLARIQPYQLGSTSFWVVTLAPEADFAPNWQAMFGGSAFIAALRSSFNQITPP